MEFHLDAVLDSPQLLTSNTKITFYQCGDVTEYIFQISHFFRICRAISQIPYITVVNRLLFRM